MLLILGLDGATLDLVEPWIAEGHLPNLARLRGAGAWGRLASTVPLFAVSSAEYDNC